MNNMMSNFNKQMQEAQLQTSVMGILSATLRGEGGTAIVSYNGTSLRILNKTFFFLNLLALGLKEKLAFVNMIFFLYREASFGKQWGFNSVYWTCFDSK